MDADLSHDPADIPRLLQAVTSCEIVLGSRYIRGGRIEHWSFFRRLVSRFGNFYARLLLHLPYRDLTGGYKCFRFETLQALDLHRISSTGYNFQIEMTYAAHRAGVRICEVPIVFTERKTGTSKFNLAIVVESFWKVLTLRLAPAPDGKDRAAAPRL
jgi:dolichol-phosphate mannosyltransferase